MGVNQTYENYFKAYYKTKQGKRAQRNAHLKRFHRMSIEECEKLFKKQLGKCAICKQKEVNREYLSVDHCHKTKKLRGLLCLKCNTGLGLFCDSAKLLNAATIYLHT